MFLLRLCLSLLSINKDCWKLYFRVYNLQIKCFCRQNTLINNVISEFIGELSVLVNGKVH